MLVLSGRAPIVRAGPSLSYGLFIGRASPLARRRRARTHDLRRETRPSNAKQRVGELKPTAGPHTDSEKSVRIRLCGIGILPMLHGLEAHATVGSSARTKPNPYKAHPTSAVLPGGWCCWRACLIKTWGFSQVPFRARHTENPPSNLEEFQLGAPRRPCLSRGRAIPR
jgi:hypothetical protein